MAAIQTLCERSLLLANGKIELDGDSKFVTSQYLKPNQTDRTRLLIEDVTLNDTTILVSNILVNNSDKAEVALSSAQREIHVLFEGSLENEAQLEIEARITDLQGRPLGFYSPGHLKGKVDKYGRGNFRIERVIRLPRITKGEYILNLFVTDPGIKYFAKIENTIRILAEGSATETGWVFEYDKGAGWVILDDLLGISES